MSVDAIVSLREWQTRVYTNAVDKGFYDESGQSNIDRSLLLVISEIAEAQNELRDGHAPQEVYFTGEKPEGFGIELADAVIRILDLCESLGIDLETLMKTKHAYNRTRPYKHGRQF